METLWLLFLLLKVVDALLTFGVCLLAIPTTVIAIVEHVVDSSEHVVSWLFELLLGSFLQLLKLRPEVALSGPIGKAF